MDAKDALTLALAVIGAVLGVLNTWRNLVADRVRVRLEVGHGFLADPSNYRLFLEIRNLSSFPVTITHVELELLGSSDHLQIPAPLFTHGETLPVRLESRTACTVLAMPPEYPSLTDIRRAYVLTACGRKITGGKRFFDLKRAAATT